MTKLRIAYAKTAPGAYSAMVGLEDYVQRSGLQPKLLELVRPSQPSSRSAMTSLRATRESQAASERRKP